MANQSRWSGWRLGQDKAFLVPELRAWIPVDRTGACPLFKVLAWERDNERRVKRSHKEAADAGLPVKKQVVTITIRTVPPRETSGAYFVSLSVQTLARIALDNLSKSTRSKVMASIKWKDTSPELAVRRLLWARGRRYRVHDRGVSGIPDISNRAAKVAVFIDGCFWHGCSQCYKEPTSNVGFWRKKLERNRERRLKVKKELETEGWEVLEFWEHEVLRDPSGVVARIEQRF